ncbi:MAG: calcium-binding EGF-like domain-containing protein, partial [Myxococcota bacterium]
MLAPRRDSTATEEEENVCLEDNGGCDPLVSCTPTPNSTRICGTCPRGYRTNGNGVQCLDIDECEGEGGGNNCDPLAPCVNLPGGFECGECPPETEDLNGDGTACDALPSSANDAVSTGQNVPVTINVLQNDT